MLHVEPVFWSTEEHPPNIGQITILGVNYPLENVLVNNVPVPYRIDTVYKVRLPTIKINGYRI